ncbi:MAG: hypothetical protein H5U14_04540 [Roseovarius sp.]|nr:hypothetical protein [Roseovarius sp.]
MNYGLILGTPLNDWDGSDIGPVCGQMRAGDRGLLDGETRVPGGLALTSLTVLYCNIVGHCGGLRPGQVVITGMLLPLTYLPGDTEIAGRIEGIGAVSVTLD